MDFDYSQFRLRRFVELEQLRRAGRVDRLRDGEWHLTEK
jgi:hypothetical protein